MGRGQPFGNVQLNIRINDCLWVRSPNVEEQQVFRPILRALDKRGAKVWKLADASEESVRGFRERVSKGDEHLILHGLLARELEALRPMLEARGNYSIILIDWWNNPFWAIHHATFQIFHNYNGIAVRTGRARFLEDAQPPWFQWPELNVRYHWMGALMRLPSIVAGPFLDLPKARQRREPVDARRLLYFPFPIAAEDVPLQQESPKYDFTNLGATMGAWIIRDAYASARLNFANLYCDRKRLIDLIVQFDGKPFAVYDRRRNYSFLPWPEVLTIIRQSRFALCTGGLQRASIPKFLEYVCLGTPIIGATLPFEYPWLDECVFPVDAMRITPGELKPKLDEALEAYPRLRANCLAAREKLLALYDAEHLLQLLQDQIDGQPMPKGYLKQ